MNIIVMRMKAVLVGTKKAILAWTWAPVAGKGLMWLGAFLALSHIGSGAAARLLEPVSQDAEASATGAIQASSDGAPVVSLASAEPVLVVSDASTRAVPSPPSARPSCRHEAGVTADGRVILNVANEADLVRLPSVGRKRAAAIVALRARLGGRFRRLEDLLRVRGIGYKLLKRMRPLVVLDPPTSQDEGAGGSADHGAS